MASIFDATNYILEKMGSVTTMKLQKLAYYSQAWTLAWTDEPLFDEDFQAWANGPVCPELFSGHRGRFILSSSELFRQGDSSRLTVDEKDIIDRVLGYYGDKDPQWLSELTHLERPWKETRGDKAPGDSCDRIISKHLIQDYYAGL